MTPEEKSLFMKVHAKAAAAVVLTLRTIPDFDKGQEENIKHVFMAHSLQMLILMNTFDPQTNQNYETEIGKLFKPKGDQ